MKHLLAAWIVLGVVVVGCQSKTEEQAPAGEPKATGNSAPAGSEPKGAYVAVQKTFGDKCAACHGAGRPKAGIDLRSYEGVLKGGEEGPVVKAGDPAGSILIKAIKHENGAKPMPIGGGKLSDAEIKAIEDWVKAGAKNG